MTVKNRALWLSLLLVISAYLSLALQSCSDRDPESDLADRIATDARYDINAFVLEKLADHRVVMIADNGHGMRVYLQSVIDILNHWVDTNMQAAVTGQSICPDLTLVLESDSLHIRALKNYFASGDFRDYLDIGFVNAPQYTSAKLEFYQDLRTLRQRIDRHNNTVESQRRLELTLFGPEMPIDLDEWSFEKRKRFFFYERDEYSSQRLLDHLAEHPQTRALVFYGSAHLGRALTAKRVGDSVAEGYYLAHYLTDSLGRDNVLVLGQMSSRIIDRRYSGIFSQPGRDYALDNPALERQPGAGLFALDGWIILFASPAPELSVYQLYSNPLLEFIVGKLPDITDLTNDFYRAFQNPVRAYLELTPARTPEPLQPGDPELIAGEIELWQQWLDTTEVDYVASIADLSLWGRPLDRLTDPDSADPRHVTALLNWSLGPQNALQWRDTLPSPPELARHYRDYLHELRPRIVVERLIHSLWVFNEEERAAALAVLTRETGQSFTTPDEWMDWWYREGYRTM